MRKKDNTTDCVNKKKGKRIILKIFIVFLGVICVLFAIINVLWFSRDIKLKNLCSDKYEWECRDLKEELDYTQYKYDPENEVGETDNIFLVSRPKYLEDVAWITMTEALVLDDDMKTYIGDYAINIQIKKHIFFPIEYVVQIRDLKKASETSSLGTIKYYITPDVELTENRYYAYTEEEKAIFEKCHEKIKSQVKELEEFFGKPIDKLV